MIKDNLLEGHILQNTISTKPRSIPNIRPNLLEVQGELNKNRTILKECNISLSELGRSCRNK